MLDRERAGTLYIARDLQDLQNRLRVGAAAVAAFLLVALAAAYLIARRMQHLIAAPLLELADTARTLSTGADDSLRATSSSNDEIGVVITAFNAMVDRISERNRALSAANEELAREIEERRRLEQERLEALERERDANRLKDEFLATLSHELRTPLGAVLGWTRVLRTTRAEGATRERALEAIERNARAQARLIEDLLEISRIVTGKLSIQVQPVDLVEVIQAAVEVVRPAAAAKRITLTNDIAVRPAYTSGDPDRLQQVVWNLVSNAVKFTPPGGAARIRLSQAHEGFHIEVSDNGQGIEAPFLPHVFDAFRQADGTTTREHGGLGLGLAIARQLVELHGGTIAARSAGAGRGSSFEVTLPSIVPEPPAHDEESDSESTADLQPDEELLHDVRVLVVDDQEDARELLKTTLAHYGAEVTLADSAAAALSAIDRERPDVVLSDLGMPREDGYALIRQLRDRPSERGGRIPAIAVTAYATANDHSSVLAAGFQAHCSVKVCNECLGQKFVVHPVELC